MKPSIKFKEDFQIFFIGISATFVWWVIFNPGFYSADSFWVLEMANSNKISSEFTAIWAIFVKWITFQGTQPQLATLFFGIIFSCAISSLIIELFGSKSTKMFTLITFISPVSGAMGITLWHDIPMTAGLLFFTTGILKCRYDLKFGSLYLLFGTFFSSFRYNGIPTLLVASTIILIIRFDWKKVVSVITILLPIFFITSNLNTSFASEISVSKDGLVNWMRYDISCFFSKNGAVVESFLENPGQYSIDEISSNSACRWFSDSSTMQDRDLVSDATVTKIWWNIFKDKPFEILLMHAKRNAYLIPIPIVGVPSPPFIMSDIEFKDKELKFMLPEIVEKIRVYVRGANMLRGILAWAGLWFAILIWLDFKCKHKYLELIVISFVLLAGLFVFAVIPDGRYVLYVLVVGHMVFLKEFLDKIGNVFPIGKRISS